MRRIFMAGAIALVFAVTGRAADVVLQVDGEKTVGHVDEKIYGQFLEHIYHSCNGGLWGEMVWSRSFEDPPDPAFVIEGDSINRTGTKGQSALVFGGINWEDYGFSFQAQKVAGEEGFAVIVRESGLQTMYEVHFGDESNTRHAIYDYTPARREQPDKRTLRVAKEGNIEAGRWYRVRMRCVGTKIEAYLDDQKVIEAEDRKIRPDGRVGIATFNASAKFRNLEVTDLQGKTLFVGWPTNVAHAGLGVGWKGYGKAVYDWSPENPLNSGHCQMVAVNEGEAGVEQTPVCVTKEESYRGSVWVRGDESAEMVARLKDGEKVLAEAKLGQARVQWKQLTCTLSPRESAENATLQIGVAGKSKVWIDQVSLMSDSSRKCGGYRPDLQQAVAELKPAVIRWPGGCFASRYWWKDGIGVQHKRVGRIKTYSDERGC